jgi:hypothetical protein
MYLVHDRTILFDKKQLSNSHIDNYWLKEKGTWEEN